MTDDKYAKKLLKAARAATAAAKKMPANSSAYNPWRNEPGMRFLAHGVLAAHRGEDPLIVLNQFIEAYKTSRDADGIGGEYPKTFLSTLAGHTWERLVHPEVVSALLLMEEQEYEQEHGAANKG